MSTTIGSQQAGGAIDSLCELIIDELKNLCATGNGLSALNLSESLARRPEILDLLGRNGCLNELRASYSGILLELIQQSDGDFRERVSSVLAKLDQAKSFDNMDGMRREVMALVEDHYAAVLEEKRAYSGLVIEIGAQLAELESKCFNLSADTTLTYKANSEFNNIMDSQVSDLQQTADSSQSLMEIRKGVKVKLETIKKALDKKRTEDQFRERRFEITIDKLQNDLKGMQERVVRVKQRKKLLEQEVMIDPLSGIANRRGLERHLGKQIKKFKRHGTVFSLLFFDIDEFKKVNDSYGHWVGDKCITSIVERVGKVLRETDFLARYGGDEFIVCLTQTERNSAHAVARKIAGAVSNTRIIYQGSEINLSVSIGVTQVEPTDNNFESVLTRADLALYEAKNQGRNLVVLA